MWISVVLIILVIVIGLIAGSRLSAPGPQRRAVNASFISLAIMAGLFFILINAFPGDWIVPFFTVACIVVPICIYVGFTRAAVSAEKAARKKSFEIPRAVTNWEDEDISAAPKATPSVSASSATTPQTTPKPAKPISAPVSEAKSTPSVSTSESPAKKEVGAKQEAPIIKPATSTPPKKSQVKPEAQTKTEPSVAQASKVDQATKAKMSSKATPSKTEKDSAKATPAATPERASMPIDASPKPVAAKTPDIKETPKIAKEIEASLTAKGAEDKPSRTPDITFVAAASADLLTGKPARTEGTGPKNKSLIAEIEALVERDLNVGRKIAEGASEEEVRAAEKAPLNYHTTAASSEKESTIPEQAPTSASPSALDSGSRNAEQPDSFTEFCKKASTLRDQGSYAVAALIFNKAVAAAPSANDARSVQFDELSCYVKAGDTTKAKALAAQLRQSSVLTRFERIKLDAVERMG